MKQVAVSVFLAVAAALLPALPAGAQNPQPGVAGAPPPPVVPQEKQVAPPEKIAPHPGQSAAPQSGNGTLSDRLSQQGSTLKPPAHVDPGMTIHPPPTGGTMPVIPPPATGQNPTAK